MTEDEKVQLVHGGATSWNSLLPRGAGGWVPDIPRLNIPDLYLADGSVGVGNSVGQATALPSSIASAASHETPPVGPFRHLPFHLAPLAPSAKVAIPDIGNSAPESCLSPSSAQPRPHANHLCFQQHSWIGGLSTFVFNNIQASFPTFPQRSFIFTEIQASFRQF
jgi:hypothetical protein